jgi:undecaprenyl-diphosphatase
MDLFQAIIYGIVQGVTEFLPVSSTAHLVLLPWFAGWQDPGMSFDIALHLGTLISLVWFFRSEWIAFARSAINVLAGRPRGQDEKMVLFIVIATIPAALAGILAEDLVETYLRSPLVIASALIGLAAVLVLAEQRGQRTKDLEEMSWTDALTVGVAQSLALVPGVSRSGITITAALFRGMKREAAARFSFFLSTPIIAGAAGKQLFDIAYGGAPQVDFIVLFVGILTSAIVGYLAIAFLLRYLATNTTYAFVYYRVVLGMVVFLAFWSGFR